MTITIHFALLGTYGGREDWRWHSEDVKQFDAALLKSLRDKHMANGFWLEEWYVTEKRRDGESDAAKNA